MKVTKTITRDCCQPKDLKPIEGTTKIANRPLFLFCVHCGSHWMSESYTDAAGGSDYRYVRLVKPWRLQPPARDDTDYRP